MCIPKTSIQSQKGTIPSTTRSHHPLAIESASFYKDINQHLQNRDIIRGQFPEAQKVLIKILNATTSSKTPDSEFKSLNVPS